MNKLTTAFLLVLLPLLGMAQLLEHTPNIIQNNTVGATIIANANFGNKGLLNHTPVTDVYVHTGVVTSLSNGNWVYDRFTWGTTNPAANATSLGGSRWQWTVPGDLRAFYGVTNPNERILKIAILFRTGSGNNALRNADGSNMYVNVYDDGYQARLSQPFRQPTLVPTNEPNTLAVGNSLAIAGKANLAGQMTLFFNGNQVAQVAADSNVATNVTIAAPGDQTVILQAVNGANTRRDTVRFLVNGAVNVAPLPAGVRDGINYRSAQDSVILVLHAPGKTRAAVIGDFSNWQETAGLQMNRTPAGDRFWIGIGGLTPGTEYAYQYLVDGTIKIADPYTEKVLDPNSDQFIGAATYPNLKPYPAGASGIVSVLQTAKPAYVWQTPNYTRVDKRNLVIYELLVRDFVAARNWNTVRDSLNYLKRLGVNAIKIMPFNEFENNESWGYNGSFFFAPDKYYGTENALKQFIDVCHQQGLMVIQDIALNHQFGQSPMVQLYWDAANNRPAANNPWFNTVAKHAFNVGFDMNHGAEATKVYTERVIEHWLTNYKIDGFRWDLSKGFTQTQTCDNNGGNCDVGAWSNYDQSRIDIWTRYNNKMQAVSPNSYCILEHFAANSEEQVLSGLGMMLWNNANNSMNEATMGWIPNSNFSSLIAANRGFQQNHLVGYMESHDEERLAFKNRQFANASNPNHNPRIDSVNFRRIGMGAAFWAMMPGPKMLWQFGELGYDYSINTCSNGTTIDPNCRTANKPIRWDYLQDQNRRNLYTTFSQLLRLRQQPAYLQTFTSGATNGSFGGAAKWMSVNGDSLKLLVVGNFSVNNETVTATFPEAGKYYSPLGGDSIDVTTLNTNFSLAPGQYYVYAKARENVNRVLALAPDRLPTLPTTIPGQLGLKIYPNPSYQGTAMVEYQLPRSGQVRIIMVSADGRQMAQLFSGRQERGYHRLNAASGRKLMPGVYQVQIRYEGQVQTKALVVAE